jgi:hypothetical protein
MLTSRSDFVVLFHFMNLPSSIVESISFALGIIPIVVPKNIPVGLNSNAGQ